MGTNPTAACEASGAGRNFMDNIKKGSIPSVAKVQMLAEYLGVSTSELLGEKIEQESITEQDVIKVARRHLLSAEALDIAFAFDDLSSGSQNEVRSFIQFKLAQEKNTP